MAFLAEGQPAESLSSSRQGLTLAEAAGDLMLQAKASNNVGTTTRSWATRGAASCTANGR